VKLELSNNAIAQMAHVGWGALLTLAPAVMFHTNVLYFALAVSVIAAGKEWWDSRGLESVALAGNSWEDWAFWEVGVTLGVTVVILSNQFGAHHVPVFHFVPSKLSLT
jgi:hypothetical protein